MSIVCALFTPDVRKSRAWSGLVEANQSTCSVSTPPSRMQSLMLSATQTSAHHHALATHTATSSTTATAPPHLTVFLMAVRTFTPGCYDAAPAFAAAPHSGHTTPAASPRRS